MENKATLKDWFLLMRPWSVTITAVVFFTALALIGTYRHNPLSWVSYVRWGMALFSGIVLQISCNLFNTWGDERSGVDKMPGAVLTTPQIQQGKITMRQTFIFACVTLFLAAAAGLPLLFYKDISGEWQFSTSLFVGALIGFIGATNYSCGLKYKYLGLGVPVSGLLMGPLYLFVALIILTPEGWPGALVASVVFSVPVMLFTGCILHGNDMRDIATDKKAGVKSMASMLGVKGALILYILFHVISHTYVVFLTVFSLRYQQRAFWFSLPLLAFPLSLRLIIHAIRDYRKNPDAPEWLNLEKDCGPVQLIFCVLYALGIYFAK